jgi:hypothetical protein
MKPVPLTNLQKRQALDSPSIKDRLVNVNSFVFGKVYFPILSNSQKDLGKYLGVTWTEPEASGLGTMRQPSGKLSTRNNPSAASITMIGCHTRVRTKYPLP